MVVSVPCDMRKGSFKDIFFQNEQISKERTYNLLQILW